MVILSKNRHQQPPHPVIWAARTARRGPAGRAGWLACRHAAALVALFAVGQLLAACSKESANDTQAAAPPPPIPVTVIEVVKRPTNPGMSFVGRVEAIENVNIMARVEGFLTQRTFTEGQAVKAGDLLFVLEKDTYQATVDSAQANLEKAQADADNLALQTLRARDLIKQQTISQATLDDRIAAEKQARAVVQQAKAALGQAQINLGYTEIHAPFDGRVGTSNFSIGALVGPSVGPLATIVSQDPIYVTFPVSDRIVLELTESQRAAATTGSVAVHITLANNMRYPETGVIDFTGIKVDPNTDTLTVRAKFPNPNNILLDGQFVQILAEAKKPVESLLIPQKAILTDQSGNYVFVVEEGNKVVQRPVTQGQTYGSDVVIQSGLKPGDMVVTVGLQRIRPGQVVDPQTIAADAPAGQPAPSTGN